MGYSHYWYRPLELPRERWRIFKDDWIKVFDELVWRGLALAGPCDELAVPVANDDLVAFNGGSESFFLARRFEDPLRPVERNGQFFSSCKTSWMPYDLAVTACLIIAKKHFAESIVVVSDGLDGDWQAARGLCQDVLRYGRAFHITTERELIERRTAKCG